MKKIFINIEEYEIKIAITKDEKLVNYLVENNLSVKPGNIYKGRVKKVIPNMNFIFVDINDEKPGFLSEKEYFDMREREYDIWDENDEIHFYNLTTKSFEKDEEILVQVIKEPYKNKGARLTTNIMLAGNFIVFCPFLKNICISKKIENPEEQQKLKEIVEKAVHKYSENFGIIIRTNAKNAKEKEIIDEIDKYYLNWQQIKENFKIKKTPSLIYEECSLYERILKEYLDNEVTEIYIDSEKEFNILKESLNFKIYNNINIKFYNGIKPIFEHFNIQQQIDSIFSNIISLKKGIYIKIDHTEALTVFDINSGKFKGDFNTEKSIYITNEMAAKEIARQIILRNIGGIIVIDFIDMKNEEDKQNIKKIMDEELSKSKYFFKTLPINEFGLMMIVRKRKEKRIDEIYFTECEKCKGRGYVLSKESICFDYLKKIKYECKKEILDKVIIELPIEIKEMIENNYKNIIEKYQNQFSKKIILKTSKKEEL